MTDPMRIAQPVQIPRELFHAFPVGSLSLLASVASVISAEHGVDTARDLFGLLVSSDPFWAELKARLEPPLAPREQAPDLPAPELPATGTSG